MYLTILPMPNNGQFTVEISNLEGNSARLEIYDLAGRRIFEYSFKVSGDQQQLETIDLSGLRSGTYILKLENGGRSLQQSVVLQSQR